MRGATRARRTIEGLRRSGRNAADNLRVARDGVPHVPQTHTNYRYRHFLLPSYIDYVSRVSWADHAVSLGTAAVLLEMCEQWRPTRVLDTGSGYSSFVLRRYASEQGAEVVSVDDDEGWMVKTAGYLDHMGVGTAGLMTWADFQKADQEPFGLIFHDLGSHATRVSSMAAVSELIADEGHVVYDDMQIGTVRNEARRLTSAAGRTYFGLQSVTLDRIHRYAGLSVAV